MSSTRITQKEDAGIVAYSTSKVLNQMNPHLEILLVRYLKKKYNTSLVSLTEPNNIYEAIEALFGQYSHKIIDLIDEIIKEKK